MTSGTLEHVNVTVSSPQKTAELLCRLFDWKIRWSGQSINGGLTYHVGNEDTYLAIYSVGSPTPPTIESYGMLNGLNHIGIVVPDIDETEQRVVAEGFNPNSHGDYEPGKRFYFDDNDGVEFEIVSYTERAKTRKQFFKQLREILEVASR